jgi:hypothetical protein
MGRCLDLPTKQDIAGSVRIKNARHPENFGSKMARSLSLYSGTMRMCCCYTLSHILALFVENFAELLRPVVTLSNQTNKRSWQESSILYHPISRTVSHQRYGSCIRLCLSWFESSIQQSRLGLMWVFLLTILNIFVYTTKLCSERCRFSFVWRWRYYFIRR